MVADVIKGGDKQPCAGRAPLCRTHGGFRSHINRAGTRTNLTGGFSGGNNDVYGVAPAIRLSQSSCFNSKGLLSRAGFQA